jgi:23S rRNA (pseudouridine1915-N3)-methyltransferase
MKAKFLSVETKTEPWVEAAKALYQKKIQPFFPIEIEEIKSPSLDRDDAVAKRKLEAEKILKKIKPTDFVVLFDETGRSFPNSEAFATEMGKTLDRSPSQLVFVVGGAFGFDESLRSRAQAAWSLGGLTFNHWIAQVVALEQLYRALTILRRIPYHNR